jgi:3-hydroxyacyl-CoA dehydrogenase
MTEDTAQARIAIIGAGFIGRSWATLFARHGHAVVIHDTDVEALASVHAAIRVSLDQLAAAGLNAAAPELVLSRIATATDLAAAVAEADYVQENAPERLDVKRALFAELDRLAPAGAILASSSSSLTCTQVCGDLPGRARCLVAHPANPPHLLRAVELVPADFTDPAVTTRAAGILRAAGQVPVVIGEIDGFVMNRLQAALAREALALVESGVADAQAIDDVVKHSLGLRWAFMGPFETMDLNAPGGFSDYAQRYGVAFARLFDENCWSAGAVGDVDRTLRAARPLDSLDSRREWRDRRLAALMAHLAGQPDD